MKTLIRFETEEVLPPKVYVSWNRFTRKVIKWDGIAVKDIIGQFDRIDGEAYDPNRSAQPGDIVVISVEHEDEEEFKNELRFF